MRDHTTHSFRYLCSGFAAWLGATAALHWLPLPTRLDPQPTPQFAALVLPGVIGDAFALAFFADFFPLIDAAASGTLAALLLAIYASMLAAGLVSALHSERHHAFGPDREDALAGRRRDGKAAGEGTE